MQALGLAWATYKSGASDTVYQLNMKIVLLQASPMRSIFCTSGPQRPRTELGWRDILPQANNLVPSEWVLSRRLRIVLGMWTVYSHAHFAKVTGRLGPSSVKTRWMI